MPKTPTERQRDWRRKVAAEKQRMKDAGLSEVRGIWAPKEHHDTIRAKAIAHADRMRKDKR